VTASPLPSGKVRVDAGWAKLVADVELKPDVDPDPPHFRIGWVQTLASSRRVGVYKTAGGQSVSKVIAAGALSDRRQYWDGDITKPRSTVAKPWYDLPEELGTEHRKVHIANFDKPGMAMEPSITDDGPFQGAKLVAIQGRDSFVTSLKAGDAGEHTLKTFEWFVPWDVPVEGITGKRDGAKMPQATVSEKDNPNLDGRTAVETNHEALETYGSVDAAAIKLKSAGYASFVALLPKHQKTDPDSYNNMILALWKADHQMRVTVIKGKEALAKDVKVTFAGDGTYAGNQDGSTFSMLAHMVLDPNKGMATPVAISVNDRVVMTIKSPYQNASVPTKIALPGMVYGTNEEDVTVKFSIS